MKSILRFRTLAFALSGTLVAASIVALALFGLKPGLDFTGGTLLEVGCPRAAAASQHAATSCTLPSSAVLRDALRAAGVTAPLLQRTDRATVLIRYPGADEQMNERVLAALRSAAPQIIALRVNFIGASVSAQLRTNAVTAILVAIVAITLYIAWAFRAISFLIPSWLYGIGAIIALVHDVLITLGVFAILGRVADVEVGIPFVAALLTILGYSVNDTIVVYDRIRENILRHARRLTFAQIADRSIRETLARSINTSLTVVIVLVAILLFGGASLTSFTLALLIGVVVGTYSSIFIATALLVVLARWLRPQAVCAPPTDTPTTMS